MELRRSLDNRKGMGSYDGLIILARRRNNYRYHLLMLWRS
jgi:hypothetical protein